MATIQLEDAMRLAAADDFWALRGKAIQGYANIEQSLASFFAVLAGTDQKSANIIFFKITNAGARNAIIEKLFQNKLGTRHNLFRNSLVKHLGPIDRERNEIVHWNVVNNVAANADGSPSSTLALIPPASWTDMIDAPQEALTTSRPSPQNAISSPAS
ncbi:MAG: hypothetical protein JWN71_4088 [Xanthobacteraceae bacterium]|nr:hypothetical protein [Xanthobacteraceae bacterium]